MWIRAMICEREVPSVRVQSDEAGSEGGERSHLRDDLQPNIDADTRSSLRDSHVDRLVVTVLEPKREESKGVLKRVSLRESDGSEEA